MIKYELAKQTLAKYVGSGGTCSDDPEVDIFVRKALQYLLYQGTHGNERKFVFCAQRGCVTLPKELEVPLKIRIDGEIGSVWNRWFEYHSGNHVDDPCLAGNEVLEEPNRYPTVYDLPISGGYPSVMGTCAESCDAHVIVKGTDPSGREIITYHEGNQIVGVYLSVVNKKIVKSNVMFGRITEVAKTVTKGYVNLLCVSEDNLRRTLLADYEPNEETPSYRRIKLLVKNCPPICRVSILGRIRLKDHYADEDLIPFDNLFLLEVAGQMISRMYNQDVQTALAQDSYVEKLVEKESSYKKVNNGQPIEMMRPLSAGVIGLPGRLRRGISGWKRGSFR